MAAPTFLEDGSQVVVLQVEIVEVGRAAVEQHALVLARRHLPQEDAVLFVKQARHVAPLVLWGGRRGEEGGVVSCLAFTSSCLYTQQTETYTCAVHKHTQLYVHIFTYSK